METVQFNIQQIISYPDINSKFHVYLILFLAWVKFETTVLLSASLCEMIHLHTKFYLYWFQP